MVIRDRSRVAIASDGFSFAQLRESYIIAGQRAYGRREPISVPDLLLGIGALRQTMVDGSRHKNAAGFLADLTKGPVE